MCVFGDAWRQQTVRSMWPGQGLEDAKTNAWPATLLRVTEEDIRRYPKTSLVQELECDDDVLNVPGVHGNVCLWEQMFGSDAILWRNDWALKRYRLLRPSEAFSFATKLMAESMKYETTSKVDIVRGYCVAKCMVHSCTSAEVEDEGSRGEMLSW